MATACDTTPVPFASLALDPRLLEGIRDLGYVETRPIQSAVITLALAAFSKAGNCFFLRDDPPNDTQYATLAALSADCRADNSAAATFGSGW